MPSLTGVTKTSSTVEIRITPQLVDSVRQMAADYSDSIQRSGPDYYMSYYLNFYPHLQALYPVATGLGVNQESKVVEIGSGIGTRCILLRGIFGCEVTGVEPHRNTYSALGNCIVELLASNPQLKYSTIASSGESTGLTANHFDFVVSFEVLEHVANPQKVLSETYRLLKKGGKAFFSTCNYASFYEGHYRIFWNPFASREASRKHIERKGLNPKFLEELNFITKRELVHYIKIAGFSKFIFDPRYGFANLPEIKVSYPLDFSLPPASAAKPTFLQGFIQKASVHKLLKLIDREYKIYLQLEK